MSDVTAPVANPLNSAVSQLLSIYDDRGLLTSSMDVGSVKRMLVHINNINNSVLSSTRDHVNAAKRLNDFALSLSRIARNSAPASEVLASRMAEIAENLRTASDELTRNDAIPNWQPPAAAN